MKYTLSAFSIAVLFLFSGCDNRLTDVELNSNPYDQEYAGPKVVMIDHGRTIIETVFTTAHPKNEIYVRPATQLYHKVNLYRNGVLIKTSPRQSYGAENLVEMIRDESPVAGVSYSYEAALVSETSVTAKSEPFSYTTTP